MNNNQQQTAQKIRAQYEERKVTELDTLRELDAKIKRPANVFAYTFGSISAIIMGAGMSLVMTDIGTVISLANPMPIGIGIGIGGMILTLINYPIYKGILSARKKKYSGKILELSEQIMTNN